MGNEGFIACTNDKEDFEWAIFFENSNPFTDVRIEESRIIAYSTLNYVYDINMEKLESIMIRHKDK